MSKEIEVKDAVTGEVHKGDPEAVKRALIESEAMPRPKPPS